MKVAELKVEVKRIRSEMTAHANQIINLKHKTDFSVPLSNIKALSEAISHLDDARQALYIIE